MTLNPPHVRHPSRGASLLLREDPGSIAVLTLNRPKSRNTLSEAMLAALGDDLPRSRGP